jgi:hypothetical protein
MSKKKGGSKIMGSVKALRTGGAQNRNEGKKGSPVGTHAKAPKGKNNPA